MITGLRTRHYRVWLVLAILLPAALWLALSTRREPVLMDELPAALRTEGGR